MFSLFIYIYFYIYLLSCLVYINIYTLRQDLSIFFGVISKIIFAYCWFFYQFMVLLIIFFTFAQKYIKLC